MEMTEIQGSRIDHHFMFFIVAFKGLKVVGVEFQESPNLENYSKLALLALLLPI